MKKAKTVIKIFLVILTAVQLLQAHPFIVKADEITPVANETELRAAIDELNTSGGSKTIELTDDVICSDTNLAPVQGELTILGNDHVLKGSFTISGTSVINLNSEGYDKTLQVITARTDSGVFDLKDTSVLNIYAGTTIGPSSGGGTAGGVQAHDQTTVNMYNGTITDCHSLFSVAGGVYIDGNAVFNMYDGLITGCTGLQGGAVGVSGAAPIGGDPEGLSTFNMYGGTISDSTDMYYGGGGVCILTSYPVIFNMNGGTITGCTGGMGGGVFIYSSDPATSINLNKGTITGNSGSYGGGVMAYVGNVTIADGFSLHNNTASIWGDDIFNYGTNVNLGTVDTTAVLNGCGHHIDGWYDDSTERWSYEECTGQPDHLELFTDTGVVCAEVYALKAAHGEPLYTVTWLNYDGTVLELDENVHEGEDPSYDGPTPVKPSDETYNYTFSGWEPDLELVHGNQTYTAVFTATPKPAPGPDPEPYYPIPKTGIE